MGLLKKGSSSYAMSMARIVVGIMFLFLGQYKVMHSEFAHGGYQKYVGEYAQESAVGLYRPFLRFTLRHPVASGYAVGVAELLIGFSMLLGLWVRPFSVVGALFMINLALCTWWRVPPGSAYWKYFGNELDNLGLLFLFVIFFAHNAGQTLGIDS